MPYLHIYKSRYTIYVNKAKASQALTILEPIRRKETRNFLVKVPTYINCLLLSHYVKNYG